MLPTVFVELLMFISKDVPMSDYRGGLATHSHKNMIFLSETLILTVHGFFVVWLHLIVNSSSPIQDLGPFYNDNMFVWLYPGHII